MEGIKFNFIENNYIFYLKLNEEATIGILEIEKEKTKYITEYEKERYYKNIDGLDYETLDKLEKKVNPKDLVKIVNYINEAIYIMCDTKERKDFLEQNLKRNYKPKVIWKIKL